jgi:NAD(P)-dependent dehydrogenase (short-subunit alcohol dehydrogenase family)
MSSAFDKNSTADDVTEGMNLTGKVYLITGCNSGLGFESVRVLVSRGATVIGTARNMEKAKVALAPLGERAVPMACDIADPKSVRQCVADVKSKNYKLDAIIANA